MLFQPIFKFPFQALVLNEVVWLNHNRRLKGQYWISLFLLKCMHNNTKGQKEIMAISIMLWRIYQHLVNICFKILVAVILGYLHIYLIERLLSLLYHFNVFIEIGLSSNLNLIWQKFFSCTHKYDFNFLWTFFACTAYNSSFWATIW